MVSSPIATQTTTSLSRVIPITARITPMAARASLILASIYRRTALAIFTGTGIGILSSAVE